MEQYNVTGMSCAACSTRVEKAVRGVEGVWANNLWFDPNGEAKLDGLTWENWRACGKEVNGRYADPCFVDARRFDFRLKPDSPAFALGFQPFDYTRAGVRARIANP